MNSDAIEEYVEEYCQAMTTDIITDYRIKTIFGQIKTKYGVIKTRLNEFIAKTPTSALFCATFVATTNACLLVFMGKLSYSRYIKYIKPAIQRFQRSPNKTYQEKLKFYKPQVEYVGCVSLLCTFQIYFTIILIKTVLQPDNGENKKNNKRVLPFF